MTTTGQPVRPWVLAGGIVSACLEILGIMTKGSSWLTTDECVVTCISSAGAGLLFAYLGLRFGAER